jgi:hypothetical protein
MVLVLPDGSTTCPGRRHTRRNHGKLLEAYLLDGLAQLDRPAICGRYE